MKSKTSCGLMQGVCLESNIEGNKVFKARQQRKLISLPCVNIQVMLQLLAPEPDEGRVLRRQILNSDGLCSLSSVEKYHED